MKRFTAIALSIILALSLFAGCGKQEEATTGIANPFVEYDTFEEAREAAGLKVHEPEIEGYEPTYYSVCDTGDGKYLQVTFEGKGKITYRAAEDFTAAELNGDYGEYVTEEGSSDLYSEVFYYSVEEEGYFVAEITMKDYNYCVMSDTALTYEEMYAITSWIEMYK